MNIAQPASGLSSLRLFSSGLLRRSLLVVAALVFGSVTFAASAGSGVDAVKRADAARIEATIAHDTVKLGSLLSEDLIYGQNDGKTLNKGRFLASVNVSQNRYTSLDYDDSQYTEVAPGVVVMTARANLKGTQKGKPADLFFRVLAVWRKENGDWKLFAYQSARSSDSAGSP